MPVGLVPPEELHERVKIGVLVPPLEGAASEFRSGAEGAGIAAYRYALAGVDVEIITSLDDGTAEGATGAMRSLADSGVGGIVLVANGPHIDGALAEATSAGLPVVMTNGQPPRGTNSVWSIAPSLESQAARIGDALADAGASRPFVVTDATRTGRLVGTKSAVLEDPAALATQVVTDFEERVIDSAIVNAPAKNAADFATAVQDRLGGRQMPLVFTPDAVTPAFSATLAESGATGGWFMSVGPNTGDQAALAHGEAAERAAAFLQALRLAAGDPDCRNIYRDDACSATSVSADIASHDAVVALVTAASRAGSTAPGDVARTLLGLKVTGDDGLAGPALDFANPSALPDAAITVLHASSTDPGLRPTSSDSAPLRMLFWFADES
ncbi:MAG: hypothetical protein LBK95_06645 [Bifidobacteriaceae bacterium]|nr:hypothetical protein [Bifidobacteriaceae bacterium]